MIPAALCWYYCRPWGHPLKVAPAVLMAEVSPSGVGSFVDPHGYTCYVYRDRRRFEAYMQSGGWFACTQEGGGLEFCNRPHHAPYDETGTYWLGRWNGQCASTRSLEASFGLLKYPYEVCQVYGVSPRASSSPSTSRP